MENITNILNFIFRSFWKFVHFWKFEIVHYSKQNLI